MYDALQLLEQIYQLPGTLQSLSDLDVEVLWHRLIALTNNHPRSGLAAVTLRLTSSLVKHQVTRISFR
jgi:hypothetical protein